MNNLSPLLSALFLGIMGLNICIYAQMQRVKLPETQICNGNKILDLTVNQSGLVFETNFLIQSTSGFNITQILNVTQEDAEHNLIYQKMLICSHVTSEDIITNFIPPSLFHETRKQLDELDGIGTSSTSSGNSPDYYGEEGSDTRSPNPGSQPEVSLRENPAEIFQTRIHQSTNVSPVSGVKKRENEIYTTLEDKVLPTFDAGSSFGFGEDLWNLPMIQKMEEAGLHPRSHRSRRSLTTTRQLLALYLRFKKKIQATNRDVVQVMGHLIKSITPFPHPRCGAKKSFDDARLCFNHHYQEIRNNPKFFLVLCMYSEYMTASMKVSITDHKIKVLHQQIRQEMKAKQVKRDGNP